MSLNYHLVVPPTVEPVSLSVAKSQCRVDIPDDNLLLQTYISVARDHCEQITNRAFFPQTYQLTLDTFPYGDCRSTIPMEQRNPLSYSSYWSDLAIRLPKPMCLSVTSITYLDPTGTPQTLDPATYYVDVNSRPARITPVAGYNWPVTQFYLPGSIQIVYQAASYAASFTETVPVAVAAGTSTPFLATLSKQVLSITSVLDTSAAPLAYSAALVSDANGDATNQTQLTFGTNPPNSQAVVTYMASTIPPTITMAIILIVGHLYENRESTSVLNLKNLPLGVDNFLRHHIFSVFGNYQSGY